MVLPSPSPGTQVLRSEGNVTPGLYFVTLSQGASAVTRKLTVLP